MTEETKAETQVKIEEIFKSECVIEKYTEDDSITYGVGFHWANGTKTGLEVQSMKEIPAALLQLGAYIVQEKLGWKPDAIKKPERKLILPGQK